MSDHRSWELFFVRKRLCGPHDQKQKLASVPKGSFRYVSTTDATVVSQKDGMEERLWRDKLEVASAVDELMRKEVLQDEEDEAHHQRAE